MSLVWSPPPTWTRSESSPGYGWSPPPTCTRGESPGCGWSPPPTWTHEAVAGVLHPPAHVVSLVQAVAGLLHPPGHVSLVQAVAGVLHPPGHLVRDMLWREHTLCTQKLTKQASTAVLSLTGPGATRHACTNSCASIYVDPGATRGTQTTLPQAGTNSCTSIQALEPHQGSSNNTA